MMWIEAAAAGTKKAAQLSSHTNQDDQEWMDADVVFGT